MKLRSSIVRALRTGWVLLWLALASAVAAGAAEQGPTAESPAEKSTSPVEPTPKVEEREPAEPPEDFRPSENIPPGSSVSFPVDI